MIILTDHKCGSSLMYKLMTILKECNQECKLENFYLWRLQNDPSEQYLLVERNPREIIVSGYLYHKVASPTNESWIHGGDYYNNWVNTFDKEDIVKYKDALELGTINFDYQSEINKLSIEDGLLFEMDYIGRLTIVGLNLMKRFIKNKKNVLTIDLENLMFNYNQTLESIISFFKLEKYKNIILSKMSKYNLLLKGDIIHNDNHLTNKQLIKDRYKKYWTDKCETKLKKISFNIS
jgi:hypothetical protein